MLFPDPEPGTCWSTGVANVDAINPGKRNCDKKLWFEIIFRGFGAIGLKRLGSGILGVLDGNRRELIQAFFAERAFCRERRSKGLGYKKAGDENHQHRICVLTEF